MLLNITTTAGCRGKCVYCPQDRFQAAMRDRPAYLTAAEFQVLTRRLRDTHFQAFSFGGFSEPFDNPEIIELFAIASQKENVEEICVYTNGEAVTPDVVQRMGRFRFGRFDISCHGFDPEVYRRTRPFIDSRRVRDNVLFILENHANIERLVISVTGPFAKPGELEELSRLCDKHHAFLDVRELHGRAGLLKIGGRAAVKSGSFRCAKYEFDKPVLLPGGDLSLCCQDFALEWIMGNLHEQTFRQIMDGSALRQHVLAVAEGARHDPGLKCYQCEFCVPL